MYLLTSIRFNGGDILFQLIMFTMLLAVPLAIIVLLLLVLRNRNNRLKRVEEKLDKLLSDKDNKKI
ncbi:hypothetical protein [Cytobacillus depressus]|uniref:hypothetical protein n=1 Tax=Cytobacillus depressus TaxID=1602942 RepID=UPI001FEA6C18|nr:hypothetical protein [Cytobacillus depressus]